MEKQFRNYFKKAETMKGVTGEILLQLLERRLDNMIYRCGFAPSRRMARQLVSHGHIMVDGRRVNIPSYLTKVGQEISVAPPSREVIQIKDSLEAASKRGFPSWIEVDSDGMSGKLMSVPTREEIALPVQEQLIVEIYSK
jgi:small subunit ribosomal protein S4